MAGVGALSGLAVGPGARLVMRLIALATGSVPVFTLATLNLLGVGVSRGVVTGLLLVAIRKYLPGSTLTKELAFGVLLPLLLAVFFFGALLPPQDLLAAPLLGGVLFTVLCLLTGITLFILVAWVVEFTRFDGDPRYEGSPITCAEATGRRERSRGGRRKRRTDQSDINKG